MSLLSVRTLKVRASNLIIVISFLFLFFVYLFVYPHSLLTSLRYPQCGHIVLVSTQRHGSTWFISNAEGCTSTNGSFGKLNAVVEIWNHGRVKNVTLEEALNLVTYNTSVKIFPDALYDQRENVKSFFVNIRDMNVPVFVLRRKLENSWASLEAAKKNHTWNLDHGGSVVKREVNFGSKYAFYLEKTRKYFMDVKRLMRDVGVEWHEVEYETIVSERLILNKQAKCYVRNCNF